MSEIKCPKCGSTNIGQYRMPTGAIWCGDCGFRVEQKETGNPFIDELPKPAPVQSAEALVLSLEKNKEREYAIELMRDFATAQRQAGRDEIAKALNLAIGCMNENPSDEAIDAFKSDPLINRIVHILRQLSEAHRQAGRDEMRSELVEGYAANILELAKRYADLVEAARLFAQYEDGDAGKCWDPSRIKLGKSLSDLGDGRK